MDGRSAETVMLLTSRPAEQLNATRWLALNRQHWGIENGLHARLDVSRRDDECRLRNRNALESLLPKTRGHDVPRPAAQKLPHL